MLIHAMAVHNDPPVSEAAAHHQECDEPNEQHNHEGDEAGQACIHFFLHLFHCGWLLGIIILVIFSWEASFYTLSFPAFALCFTSWREKKEKPTVTHKDVFDGGSVGVVDEGGVALVQALQHQGDWHHLVCLVHQVQQHVCPARCTQGS